MRHAEEDRFEVVVCQCLILTFEDQFLQMGKVEMADVGMSWDRADVGMSCDQT